MNLREDQELESCTQNKEWNEEELDEAILLINKQINENQREKDKGREIKKSLRRAKEVIKKKAQNQIRLSILGDRNSYSNTDLDGTARCQKDKISIKPGYNEGIATNNSFVVNFEVSQRGGDTSNFIDLIKGAKDNLEEKPGLVHSDGAYGSEENMTYLEKEGIGNYLKYNTYRREHSKKWHQERVRKEDFLYDHENDRYRCPGGKYLNFYLEQEKKTTNGFLRRLRRYQADKNDCRDCPFKQSCTTNDSRGIEVSPHYERLKAQARENLGSERGKELCRRRGFEVETTPLKL